MHTLNIDIETYSETSLKKSGLYKYVEDPSFEILMIAFSLDDGEEQIVDLKMGEQLPTWFLVALTDPDYKKTAWNAQFEITCLNAFFHMDNILNQWECTMIKASMLSYPMELDKAGKALKLEVQKDKLGKSLIKFFSEPQRPKGKQAYRNLPQHNLLKWQQFKNYCIFDVKVEKTIGKKIHYLKISDREREFWHLDQKINRAGVLIDIPFVQAAVNLNESKQKELLQEAIKLTGLSNPNSIAQVKKWLSEETGDEIKQLGKDNVKDMLKEGYGEHINNLLQLRQQMSKSSIDKFKRMLVSANTDNRIRGIHQFYGANKTGRWAGRIIQGQNLTHTKLPGIKETTINNLVDARKLVYQEDRDSIELIYGSLSETLSALVRTCIVAPEGKELLVSDLAAIEARITAWFAQEKWRIDVFNGHGKIYEASGSQMFKMPIERVKGDVRSRAKVAELALGYQGGVNAMERMGAYKMGLKPAELPGLVRLWRDTNPNIVKLWYDVQSMAIKAIESPGIPYKLFGLTFISRNRMLFIQLPSGRLLSYANPWLEEGLYGMTIFYWGTDQFTKKWSKQNTYGGKLVENIVQGTARDILADIMVRLDKAELPIIMHVHDEVVGEIDKGSSNFWLPTADKIMSTEIPWCKGLPLAAKSFVSDFYLKD